MNTTVDDFIATFNKSYIFNSMEPKRIQMESVKVFLDNYTSELSQEDTLKLAKLLQSMNEGAPVSVSNETT